MAKSTHPIISVHDVKKTFMIGQQKLEILKGITFDIETGDFVVIFGPSGCGKSTLLHIILGLEEPSSGMINFLGEDIFNHTDEDYRSNFRKKHIGMVYQQANWIKALKVNENVGFPLILLGMPREEAIKKAVESLKQVEMDNWAEYVPTELSSGQQQRVSLARALTNNPEIIIADEPTGNLDFKSGQDMMQLLFNLNKEHGKTVIMVTHDLEYISYAQTAIRMLDGEVIGIYQGKEKEELLSGLNLKRGANKVAQVMVAEKKTGETTVKSDETKNETQTEETKPVAKMKTLTV